MTDRKRKYYSQLVELLRTADVAIEVVDARFPEQTRVEKLERRFSKKLLVVFSKADLVPKERRMQGGLYFSSRTREGVEAILVKARRIALDNPYRRTKDAKAVVFGIPNVGKSSLINALRKRYAAKTGFRAGLTRGPQWIRLSEDMFLCDTAGVVEIGENAHSLAIKSALDVGDLPNPEGVAAELISKAAALSPNPIALHYGIEPTQDSQALLEALARKRGLLGKGNQPLLSEAAKVLVRDYQKGKFLLQ